MDMTDSLSTAEPFELPAISSLAYLVDPTAALTAATRLYAAPGPGLRHSGWDGRTVIRRGSSVSAEEIAFETCLDEDDSDDDGAELH